MVRSHLSVSHSLPSQHPPAGPYHLSGSSGSLDWTIFTLPPFPPAARESSSYPPRPCLGVSSAEMATGSGRTSKQNLINLCLLRNNKIQDGCWLCACACACACGWLGREVMRQGCVSGQVEGRGGEREKDRVREGARYGRHI